MAAEYRDKRTLITTVRGKYLSFATFPAPLLSHCPLPLRKQIIRTIFHNFISTNRVVFLKRKVGETVCWNLENRLDIFGLKIEGHTVIFSSQIVKKITIAYRSACYSFRATNPIPATLAIPQVINL
jgi:hypothetical protein